MARSDQALARVRRAYEAAHLAAAVRALAIGGALCVVALGLYDAAHATWLVAALLLGALGTLAWQGGAWRRGALAGVIAGLPPLIVPSIVMAFHGHNLRCGGCDHGAMWACVLACFGTSSLVGLLVGYRASAEASPRRFAIGAIATAALTGLLGCGTTGLGGAAGVVIGVVAGGVTGWVVAGRTAQA
jgi:hypothetical protein